MGRRAALFTTNDVKRLISGALASGLEVGEVRVLRDGSIVLHPTPSRLAILNDDIDEKLEAFARK